MTQIPKINIAALDQYDRALSDPNSMKAGDKRRKDKFKKLIAGALGVMLCSATREQRSCSLGDLSGAGSSTQQRRDSACRLLRFNMAVVRQLAVFNSGLSSNSVPPSTDGPVPAVQEGGAHSESSIALQKAKAGQGFAEHRTAGSGGALRSRLEEVAL